MGKREGEGEGEREKEQTAGGGGEDFAKLAVISSVVTANVRLQWTVILLQWESLPNHPIFQGKPEWKILDRSTCF